MAVETMKYVITSTKGVQLITQSEKIVVPARMLPTMFDVKDETEKRLLMVVATEPERPPCCSRLGGKMFLLKSMT